MDKTFNQVLSTIKCRMVYNEIYRFIYSRRLVILMRGGGHLEVSGYLVVFVFNLGCEIVSDVSNLSDIVLNN